MVKNSFISLIKSSLSVYDYQKVKEKEDVKSRIKSMHKKKRINSKKIVAYFVDLLFIILFLLIILQWNNFVSKQYNINIKSGVNLNVNAQTNFNNLNSDLSRLDSFIRNVILFSLGWFFVVILLSSLFAAFFWMLVVKDKEDYKKNNKNKSVGSFFKKTFRIFYWKFFSLIILSFFVLAGLIMLALLKNYVGEFVLYFIIILSFFYLTFQSFNAYSYKLSFLKSSKFFLKLLVKTNFLLSFILFFAIFALIFLGVRFLDYKSLILVRDLFFLFSFSFVFSFQRILVMNLAI